MSGAAWLALGTFLAAFLPLWTLLWLWLYGAWPKPRGGVPS